MDIQYINLWIFSDIELKASPLMDIQFWILKHFGYRQSIQVDTLKFWIWVSNESSRFMDI